MPTNDNDSMQIMAVKTGLIKNKKLGKKIPADKIIYLAALTIVSCLMALPLLWMITTALKGPGIVFANPPQWLPKEWHWENFAISIQLVRFWNLLFNSLLISTLATGLQVFTSAYVAFGLSRINFPGRQIWFYLFIGSMMLPSIATLIPVFKIMLKLNWLNTYLPLWVPPAFGNPFFIFLARQFYASIPVSLDESAQLDGAGPWTVFFKIFLPLSKPALVTMVLMSFLTSWSDYLNPLIYIIDSNKWTLALGIASFSGSYTVKWNYLMAVNLLYMIPPVILFFCAQKYFIKGLGSMSASIK